MSKSAREMFEEMGYEYQYIDNENCEDVILYTHRTQDVVIQFNLLSKMVVYQIKNTMQEYDEIVLFMTKQLIQSISRQMEELGWND